MNHEIANLETLLRELGLDEPQIAERKAFLGLGAEDIVLLKALHARLQQANVQSTFVDRFYAHLLAFPGAHAFLRDPASVKRLKRAQAKYFDSLTAGDYDLDYVYDRLRVGIVHERINLDVKWYLGAYGKYLDFFLVEIHALLPGDPKRAERTVSALLKVILFDIGLAMDTYMHAAQQSLLRKNAQFDALNQLAVSLNSAGGLTATLDQAMVHGAELVGAHAACVVFYDQKTRRFTDRMTHGLSTRFVGQMQFRTGGLAEEVFSSGSHAISNDRPETRHRLSALAHAEGIQGYICLPLASGGDRLGVIYFYRADRDSFEQNEIELLTLFARLASSAIKNARLTARLEEEASVDALTGIHNRRVFERALAREHRRAKRYANAYALLMIDIDHFKNVNDTFGHQAGDAILAAIAGRIASRVRDVDLATRYGGEEFAVMLPEIPGAAAKEFAEDIRRVIADMPFTLPDGRPITMTVSIGASCYPECAGDAASVVETADRALYCAKESGRDRVVLYSEMTASPVRLI